MRYTLILFALIVAGCGAEVEGPSMACETVNESHCEWACSCAGDPALCASCDAGEPLPCFDYCADYSEKTWPIAGRACVKTAISAAETCAPWPGDVCADACDG